MNRNTFITQGILQIFIGISAVFGGLSLVIDPSGDFLDMPLELLSGSPFQEFLNTGIDSLRCKWRGEFVWFNRDVSTKTLCRALGSRPRLANDHLDSCAGCHDRTGELAAAVLFCAGGAVSGVGDGCPQNSIAATNLFLERIG